MIKSKFYYRIDYRPFQISDYKISGKIARKLSTATLWDRFTGSYKTVCQELMPCRMLTVCSDPLSSSVRWKVRRMNQFSGEPEAWHDRPG